MTSINADDTQTATSYRVLADRCRTLEEDQAKLREQFHQLLHQKEAEQEEEEEEAVVSDSTVRFLSRNFFSGGPYATVLKCMGHAVHVYKASSGEIIYWNRSAETLYGWKDYEIIGQRVSKFLVTEEYYASLQNILERLITGVPWSGKFPFKKRSGEVFMAMVTKTPLYEDGELVGIITVSSDAAVFNSMDSENRRTYQPGNNGKAGGQRINFKRIQWPPRPLIGPVPKIASSVSNLASKILLNRHPDDAFSRNTTTDEDEEKPEKNSIHETEQNSSHQRGERITLREASEKVKSTIAARVLAKLQTRGSEKCGKDDGSNKNNCTSDCSKSNRVNNEVDPSGGSVALTPHNVVANGEDREDPLLRLHCHFNPKKMEQEAIKVVIEDEMKKQREGVQLSSTRESTGSNGSSSSKGDSESNSVVEAEIHWEDLQLREEIGQGSYAVVYHGIWNGSDVAVKVYFGNGYTEETLHDYKKEIDIMKRLRHPNVLLFMGAVYSQERLAIVTELLPRGSLFKILHKTNQSLDIRRLLRMALDVTKGMNYLHHRNPPIVHRDLKSSNLLVDKNWTVKVGDFGLSRLKDATLLTSKSGRGTPQWMAPEVLRNEPSNEKSDVYSFGVILWELMTQSIPWENLNSLQVVGVVGFMDRRLDLPEGLDPQVASVIRDCWKSDPEQRPSFQELIKRMMFLVNKVNAASTRRISES
ncbi:hypothetical protein PIB30_061230 [Stylosanthes scabra]|uniref:Uncharacterized protein n=1 Tax=Stylosanthes scabra TaxID=79078 RepID=A0ABU6TN66_9FABA|nr:hypothetical protein [Stylosanthes scabra]